MFVHINFEQNVTYLEIPFMNANFKFRIFHLQLWNELSGDPGVVIMTIGDEDIIQVAHVFLFHWLVLPSLLHQPKCDEKSFSVCSNDEDQQDGSHCWETYNQSLKVSIKKIKSFAISIVKFYLWKDAFSINFWSWYSL